MPSKKIWLLLGLSLTLIAPWPSSAGETGWTSVGVRLGISASDDSENFEQYEVFATRGLPWGWHLSSGWNVDTKLDVSVAALDGGGETAYLVSAGPNFIFNKEGSSVSLDIGISPTLLSEHEFGRENLGGAIQFISHAGINFQLGRNLDAGYRLQHMSNASLYDSNPGLNLHVLQLNYRF